MVAYPLYAAHDNQTTQPLPWWQGWLPLFVLPALVFVLVPQQWPRWVFMWIFAFAIYCGCKWLTWRRTMIVGVPWWQQAGYLLAWPGLDAPAFLKTPAALPHVKRAEWLGALSKFLMGISLFLCAHEIIPVTYPYVLGCVGMVGNVMLLHFGLFHLLSCAWRTCGIDAKPLMNWPLTATSVSDFWGRRWNTAFRDLTHRFLFRPLTARYGARFALGSVFFFSGIVHDLVISVPAGGGYGGPTVFFIIQGIGLFVERSKSGRRLGLGRGYRGWLFTLVVLLAPFYLLFHPPFVLGIVLPFMQQMKELL